MKIICSLYLFGFSTEKKKRKSTITKDFSVEVSKEGLLSWLPIQQSFPWFPNPLAFMFMLHVKGDRPVQRVGESAPRAEPQPASHGFSTPFCPGRQATRPNAPGCHSPGFYSHFPPRSTRCSQPKLSENRVNLISPVTQVRQVGLSRLLTESTFTCKPINEICLLIIIIILLSVFALHLHLTRLSVLYDN